MYKANNYGGVVITGIVLAALTVLEYFMAINHFGAALLLLVAALKAIIVVYFFMHVSRLWAPEGEH